MQYHIDGSTIMLSNHKSVLGWAIVEGSDEMREMTGAMLVKNKMSCEMIALFKLFEMLDKSEWKTTVIHTDSEEVTQPLKVLLHNDTYVSKQNEWKKQFTEWLRRLQIEATAEDVVEFFKTVRFQKVKGHRNIVENERADFLCKRTAYQYVYDNDLAQYLKKGHRATVLPYLEFVEWLHQGIEFFNYKTDSFERHFPAFTASIVD